jgi:DNA polymerase elongation subunit (family B)
LADRITARDPGNKPAPGDRIPFVYINTNNKKALQGDCIETPTFITENNLQIDYTFYIKNKIMRPIQKVFSLVLEKIWELQNKKAKIVKFRKEVDALREKYPEKTVFDKKLENLKFKELQILLFDEFLRETINKKEGVLNIKSFFTVHY